MIPKSFGAGREIVPTTTEAYHLSEKPSRVETHYGKTLTWKGLSLDIESNGKQKRLLNDLNGSSL